MLAMNYPNDSKEAYVNPVSTRDLNLMASLLPTINALVVGFAEAINARHDGLIDIEPMTGFRSDKAVIEFKERGQGKVGFWWRIFTSYQNYTDRTQAQEFECYKIDFTYKDGSLWMTVNHRLLGNSMHYEQKVVSHLSAKDVRDLLIDILESFNELASLLRGDVCINLDATVQISELFRMAKIGKWKYGRDFTAVTLALRQLLLGLPVTVAIPHAAGSTVTYHLSRK